MAQLIPDFTAINSWQKDLSIWSNIKVKLKILLFDISKFYDSQSTIMKTVNNHEFIEFGLVNDPNYNAKWIFPT